MASLLPPNATAYERALEADAARLDDIDIPIDALWDPWRCPAAFLPWLAWSQSVDTWDPAWPESVKRKVIAAAFDVHRVKGTLGALRRALEALDLDGVTIAEWFDYAGDPYTFRVDVELSTRGLSEAEYHGIEAAILTAKNVRSWLDRLRVYLSNRSAVPVIATALTAGETVTVYPYSVGEIEVSNTVPVVALGHYGVEIVTLYPM